VTTDSLHYTLLIKSAPFDDETNETAAAFAAAVLAAGHKIDRVFFYQDAVLIASDTLTPPQGQQPLHSHWAKLKEQYPLPLQVCIANALRRGILDDSEASRYDKIKTLSEGFELCGLGEMAEAMKQSDRLITF